MATKQSKTKAPAVPPMHPRERLTKKAEAAISKYATLKCGDLPLHHFMVAAVLEAERMPRERLYAWLEGKGYQWRSASGIWVQRKQGSGAAGQGGEA